MLRESAKNDPDWVDDQLTPAEQLIPQEFGRDGERATIEYMACDLETGWALAKFMSSLFTVAGIEVAGTYVIDECDVEVGANDDEEFERLINC